MSAGLTALKILTKLIEDPEEFAATTQKQGKAIGDLFEIWNKPIKGEIEEEVIHLIITCVLFAGYLSDKLGLPRDALARLAQDPGSLGMSVGAFSDKVH